MLEDWTLTATERCDRNYAFTDADGDELAGDDERGTLLECP